MSATSIMATFDSFHQKFKDGLDNGSITREYYFLAYFKWISEYFDTISKEASLTTETPNPATESFKLTLLQYQTVVMLYDARRQLTKDMATAVCPLLLWISLHVPLYLSNVDFHS